MKMLINEFYNVLSNAPLLGVLYVNTARKGDVEARASYEFLGEIWPYKIELYHMPALCKCYGVIDSIKQWATKLCYINKSD